MMSRHIEVGGETREKITRLAKQVKEHLIKRYGKAIREVILYGSYARGEATEDSDIDLLVLVDDSVDPFEVRKSMSDLLFDMLLDDGELVSVVVLPQEFFYTRDYPFMLNVREEGVKV